MEKVRASEWGHGLNAATGEFVDLVAAGVIDPVKVTRNAVINAASIAGMLLTTESLVVEKPEKPEPRRRGDARPGGALAPLHASRHGRLRRQASAGYSLTPGLQSLYRFRCLDQQDAARSSAGSDRVLLLGLVLAGFVAVPAWATETPRYEPAPSWVVPAPPIRQGASPPPLVAVLDEQTRIADGTVWTYREVGARAVSADALARLGALTLNWQPFHGDLIVHRVDIVRDGQHIDVLKAGQKFSVIRREQGLEILEMNGILTATLQVEGLRRRRLPRRRLLGNGQGSRVEGRRPGRRDCRVRAIQGRFRPRPLHVAGRHPRFVAGAPRRPDGSRDRQGRLALSPKLRAAWSSSPACQPTRRCGSSRFRRSRSARSPTGRRSPPSSRPFTEPMVSSRRVRRSRRKSPGFALARPIRCGGPRRRFRWSRTVSAISPRAVNGGNYVPHSTDKTWSAGYGDCKAKTLLLLAGHAARARNRCRAGPGLHRP